MTESFDEKLNKKIVADTRLADAKIRADAETVAIVDISLMMHDLVKFMPRYKTEAEQAAYLEAVKDIQLQARPACLDHDKDTGELVKSIVNLNLASKIVDTAYVEWLSTRSSK